MRVRDLRPSGSSGPELLVLASEAAEFLRFLGVLVDDDQRYDLGAERISRIRESLPPGLLPELRDLDLGSGVAFHVLSLLAAWLPAPAGVDQLFEALERDPALGWGLLLAHVASRDDASDHATLEAAADGDADAVADVRQALMDAPDPPAGATKLLSVHPGDHGRRLLAALRAARPVWEPAAAEAMAAIGRDVAHRRAQVDQGVPVADIVLAATNGYELSTDPAIRRIVLLPSYWNRPWLVVGRRAEAEVLGTVVAEEFLTLPPEAPPPALLKLFKALGDEGRLKLLRRLSAGPISLSEATAELGVAKATAHHHLSILRQAGLVTIGGTGRAARYALRDEPGAAAANGLAHYLHPDGTGP